MIIVCLQSASVSVLNLESYRHTEATSCNSAFAFFFRFCFLTFAMSGKEQERDEQDLFALSMPPIISKLCIWKEKTQLL